MINILKKIHEPSSSISDLILSLFCFYWFYDLTTIFFYNKSNTLFFSLIIFFILGISALLGSFFHMFAKIISNKLIGFNFKIAVFTIGLILLLFSFLYIDLLLKNNLKFVIGSFFSLTIIFFYYQFLKTKKNAFAIILLPILLFIGFGVWFQLMANKPGSEEVLTGFLIILTGLILWKNDLSINQNFNKNDIFHYVSIIGLWYLHKGYKLLIF